MPIPDRCSSQINNPRCDRYLDSRARIRRSRSLASRGKKRSPLLLTSRSAINRDTERASPPPSNRKGAAIARSSQRFCARVAARRRRRRVAISSRDPDFPNLLRNSEFFSITRMKTHFFLSELDRFLECNNGFRRPLKLLSRSVPLIACYFC